MQTPPVKPSWEWWEDPANVQAIRHHAHLSGLLYGSKDLPLSCAVNMSVTLQPWDFPQELFHRVWSLQPDLNALMDAVSRDTEFLSEALGSVIEVDNFTARLVQLLLDSQPQANSQPKTVLGIHRSDYLLDYKKNGSDKSCLGIKQVEINTIGASLGGLNQGAIQNFHHYVHSRYFGKTKPLNLPEPSCLADCLATAWKQYGNPSACLLCVVYESERNIYDQRVVEFDLWNRYRVKTIRRSLSELAAEAKLGARQELIVSTLEVAVVYYRAGYDPDDYSSEKDWSTRLLLERSRAASCPSAAYQLVGTKKVQQVLAAPGVLERFVDDAEKIERIRSVFAGLHSLNMGPEGDNAIAAALEKPNDFVLKPQREGGGNNFNGEEMRGVLERVKSSREREGYILMEKLHPPTQRGLVLGTMAEAVETLDLVCELGIFGLYVRHGNEVLLNKCGGCLARSKASTSHEGGINVLAGALDAVNLVPTTQFLSHLHEDPHKGLDKEE